MLFKIAGTNSYLLGTIHVLPPGTVLPAALTALTKTHELVIEHFEQPRTVPLERSDGRVLADDLDAETYRNLEIVWEQLNINHILLARQAPWRIGLIVAVNLLPQLGLDPAFGVDRQLQLASRSTGKEPMPLETLDSVLECMWKISTDELVRNMRQASNLDEARNRIRTMVNAWMDDDMDKLIPVIQTMVERAPDSHNRLLVTRNRTWVPKIVSHVSSGKPILIAVGCLHLVGPNSVRDLLREAGYETMQIAGPK